LPTAALLPDVQCVLPAGSYISPDLLFEEMQKANLSPSRLIIDPNAVVLTERELAQEKASALKSSIGSTLSGTGAGVAGRIGRLGEVLLARDDARLKPFVRPTTPFLVEQLRKRERVIIEGTQGFGLSVLHSPFYPYATSRDTTAAGFVAEAGLSPLDVDDVIVVIRAFPIRVAGNSGPLAQEISWGDLTQESGSKVQITEYTSVTKTLRRVGRFEPEVVRQAILYNRPTRIVFNHVDYVEVGSGVLSDLTDKTRSFVQRIEGEIGHHIGYIGFGPAQLTITKSHNSACAA
jgi:adenylosuccinate synthase